MGESSDKIQQPPNASSAARHRRGDVEAGFREADAVVERTYRTPWVHQAHLEPQSCVAMPDGMGGITLHTSTQAAYQTRSEVASALGIAQQKVKVVSMEIGGGFGAKYALLDPLVAALAWKMVVRYASSLRVTKSFEPPIPRRHNHACQDRRPP